MTSSPRFRRFAFAYGSAFAILYVIALKLDLALFTVYPTMGVVLLGTHHSRDTVAPVDGELSTRDVLVRLDCDGCVGRADIRPRRRSLARALVTTVLVGVVVGASRGSDDRVRLPHAALVSTLVTCPFPSCS